MPRLTNFSMPGRRSTGFHPVQNIERQCDNEEEDPLPQGRKDDHESALGIQVDEDKLKWEVLNRVHRLLNQANIQKQ